MTSMIVAQQQQQQQQPLLCRHRRRHSGTTLHLSRGQPNNKTSRLEGNQREPSTRDMAIMDEMIHKLLDAEIYELPNAVRNAFRVIRTPRFFLRIAELADQAAAKNNENSSDGNHIAAARYTNLAQNLVNTIDALVSSAQESLNDWTESIETIVRAAAEPDTGEFLVPLTLERIAATKAAFLAYDDDNKNHQMNTPASADAVAAIVASTTAAKDEGFLSTIDSWMNKAHLDGIDGMVEILQSVVQIYAAQRILQQLDKNKNHHKPSKLMITLLNEPPTTWERTIRDYNQNNNNKSMFPDDVDSLSSSTSTSPNDNNTIHREIQRHMETIVLSMETGSLRQKVQAEFLREMLRVAELAVSST